MVNKGIAETVNKYFYKSAAENTIKVAEAELDQVFDIRKVLMKVERD